MWQLKKNQACPIFFKAHPILFHVVMDFAENLTLESGAVAVSFKKKLFYSVAKVFTPF